jgi:hypothetical protein
MAGRLKRELPLVFFIMRQIVKSLQTTERYIQNLNHDLSEIMGLLDVNLLQSTTKEKKGVRK